MTRSERNRRFREQNPDYHRKYCTANPERKRISNRRWQLTHPGHRAANEARRRATKLRATPKWLTKEQLEEIRQFYLNCPKGYHVDHIHPLKGKGLCGLHVPWNLQYLTASENVHKYNNIGV